LILNLGLDMTIYSLYMITNPMMKIVFLIHKMTKYALYSLVGQYLH